ncbi:MAG: hypothetical protein A3F11_06855 [Gammaproteobacteria bacterium RIFCSPHIGHO2_12_FULL_37_14]|nr:MAG: hypothetical protein A3F11_06855 [Gammaproteobacteria bacterium RIFCSPHIGHO2_12_FULL_37_14]
MKIKLLRLSMMVGVLATVLSCVTPAMAEDNDFNQTLSASNDNTMQQSQDNNMPTGSSSTGDASSTTADEGSPDTATGDDDY